MRFSRREPGPAPSFLGRLVGLVDDRKDVRWDCVGDDDSSTPALREDCFRFDIFGQWEWEGRAVDFG